MKRRANDTGVVPPRRYDGAGLRTDCWNLTVLIRFLRRQSPSEEDCHDVQTFFRTAVLTGNTIIYLSGRHKNTKS